MKPRLALALAFSLVLGPWGRAQELNLPPRPAGAPGGAEFIRRITPLDLAQREKEIYAQVMSGNVPGFLRRLCPVPVTQAAADRTNTAAFFVTPDYLAIGSDADYFLTPISPHLGQRIADALNCSLPTPRMVNAIYAAAAVKLPPAPVPPGAAMITVPCFSNHNAIVWAQRAERLQEHPLGALVAGHQKDVVITARLTNAPGKVAIYGWHQTNGAPIQPLYLKHIAAWVDYSQCTRLVWQPLRVNGQSRTVAEVLADPGLAGLLSDEGVVLNPRYPTNAVKPIPGSDGSPVSTPAAGGPAAPPGAAAAPLATTGTAFTRTNGFGERLASFTIEPEVKVLVDAPLPAAFAAGKPVLLILYTLPNGNTTAQTFGKVLKPGDDWHYNIQHIGAQTRFLRQILTNRVVVVAYLESAMKSWPAWRKAHGDKLIPGIVGVVQKLFAGQPVETVLSSHSGGGSFIFGYLNAVERIPDEVVRIAFLDSNYAYDPALGHETKLARWLKADPRHCFCLLAYHDAIALLNGKSFVSAQGGTWGRSHAMLKDFAADFAFTSRTNGELETYSALEGRLQLLLKQNPERAILHTVQVERNGFIHAILSGTPNQGRGYEYFGDRAYSRWIDENQTD
jgi:hypothetical protein